MGYAFKKAEKKQAKLRLAMTGPSGAGKTYSALKIASGIGSRIAVLDTENHSASLYADEFKFDTLEIDSPYTIQKYLEGINAAVSAGYDVLIIDSISHAWAGEGGLIEKKDALDVRGGNSYTNWGSITKEHEKFKAALLGCNIHLIVTMRSKQDYILEINDKGKSAPRKVGLAPIQRDGMEYEFTMVLDCAMDHNASVSKTRIRSFDGKLFIPSEKTGRELLAWLNDGVAAPITPVALEVHSAPAIEAEETMQGDAQEPEDAPRPLSEILADESIKPQKSSFVPEKSAWVQNEGCISEKQGKRFFAIAKTNGKNNSDIKTYLVSLGIEHTNKMPWRKYEAACKWAEEK